ncbi:MAG: cation transporter [Eubacterium sp.]|nr:cation transporter [Eubacterium sp.]
MKKTYKVDVDCAACAEKMQDAIKNTKGVKDATLSFMTLKCKVEFEDDVTDFDAVMQEARKNCKKVEDDMEIYL